MIRTKTTISSWTKAKIHLNKSKYPNNSMNNTDNFYRKEKYTATQQKTHGQRAKIFFSSKREQ